MASLSVTEFVRQVRSTVSDSEDTIWGDLDAVTADMFCAVLEGMAESEVEQRTGVRYRERSPHRQEQRNGYRRRQVQTAFTKVTIRVPRLRDSGFIPSFLEPNHRAVSIVERWVERALLAGVSRAGLIRLLESTTGCRPSEGLLKRVQAKLDEEARAFRMRPLSGRYEYLFLDAAWVKDIVGVHARRICILTAIGITVDGCKEILGFERVQRECGASWGRLLDHLLNRGLDRFALKMVISDEHLGILQAVEEKLGDVPHQLCWAHRCRNLFKAVLASDRKEMAKSLRSIYQAAHRKEALNQFREFKEQWRERYPSLTGGLGEDLGHLLAFFDCPLLHQEYVRTTNPIERTFLELRRSRFGCGAFASRASCDRVVANVFRRLNELWQGRDIWRMRTERNKRKEQRASRSAARPAHCTDPVPGARVAPQQSPILPDGCSVDSREVALCPA